MAATRWIAAGMVTLFAAAVGGCGSQTDGVPSAEAERPKLSVDEISDMRTRLERSLVKDNGAPPRMLGRLGTMPVLNVFRELSLQQTAADSLARIGVASVPTLQRALSDRDAGVRARAAQALARIGPEAKDAVPALTSALTDTDANVRRQAARALGQVGAAAESAIPQLAHILAQPEEHEEYKLPQVTMPATPAAPGPSPSDR
jgi:hypothetical protein